jgi:hypothetical protein
MDIALQREIESLRQLKTKQLQQRFQELFGEKSPSSNRVHLFRRIAWRLQARAEGDLSQRARERAAELAQDVNLRLRAPRSFWDELESKSPNPDARRDPRLPAAGTVLTRVYRGAPVLVKVLERGFEYNGATYTSLSSIAYRATGTRWNGFLFFGLKGRERA